ncbi:MAG: hypothetical protein WA182_11175, partial [Candidatus Sulfotelmatobacter sp.]
AMSRPRRKALALPAAAASVVSRAKGYNLSWRASGGIFSAALPRLTFFPQTKRIMEYVAHWFRTKHLNFAIIVLDSLSVCQIFQ